jgi:hypothetical protein
VAVREKLFKILTKAHKQCQHGGRDKTSAHVRRTYSWQVSGRTTCITTTDKLVRVPKELISRFVKLCPTCQVRRGTSRNSPPESERSPEEMTDPQSPEVPCGPSSRKTSSAHKQIATSEHVPSQAAGFASSSAFEQQNRWMTPLPPQDSSIGRSTHLTINNTLNSHEGYNTIPPIPMNCTNATPPGLSFSSGNPFVNGTTTSAAYAAGPTYQASRGHLPTSHSYGVKIEQTYM